MLEEIDIGVLADSLTEFMSAKWPLDQSVAYSHGDATHGAGLWPKVSALGWPPLTVAESHGRLGLDARAAAAGHVALGGGNAVLTATIEYMKVREQFGRPIGSFHALKHRVADMLEAA